MTTNKEQIDSLTLTLRQMRYEYYRYSCPVTSDYLYDMLERLLKRLEEESPEHRHINSPTATVGSDTYDEELEKLRKDFVTAWYDGYSNYEPPAIKHWSQE